MVCLREILICSSLFTHLFFLLYLRVVIFSYYFCLYMEEDNTSRELYIPSFYRSIESRKENLCNTCKYMITFYVFGHVEAHKCKGCEKSVFTCYCYDCSMRDNVCQKCGESTKVYWYTFETFNK